MKRRGEAGQVLPLIALCLAGLMGFAGMGVDVGFLEYQQRQAQSAADAAALGGAQQLLYSGCGNYAAANTAALADSSTNGFASSANVTVNVENPPSAGAYAGNACAVRAQITSAHTRTFFTRLFGYPNGMKETVEAVAALVSNNDGCIYLLDPTQTFQLNGTTINAPNCGILSNAAVQTNGGTVNVGSFGYAGALQDNSTSFTKASPSKMLPVADPCAEIPGCAYLAANPPATTGCTTYQENGVAGAVMRPGCYSLVQFNGGSVTMLPGQYVFTGVVQDNGPPVTGTGVTIYVARGAGPVQFNGSTETFSPPTTGNTAGVLFYQAPSNKSVVQFNGSTSNLSGLVYAPGALGQINGASGGYLVLVLANAQLNGGYTMDPGNPPAGQTLIKNAVLAQ